MLDALRSDPVAVSDRLEGLDAIREPGCAAAVWRRPTPGFHGWLDALPAASLPKGRLILRPRSARTGAVRLCEEAGTPGGPERDALCDDVAMLAEAFARLMDAEWLRLRLDAQATDGCRRFHVDAIRARLVCTYRGAGTQFGMSTDGGAPAAVHQVATGAPILLRGKLWPAGTEGLLLHRSPPIEGTGATRLLLVLDAVEGPGA